MSKKKLTEDEILKTLADGIKKSKILDNRLYPAKLADIYEYHDLIVIKSKCNNYLRKCKKYNFLGDIKKAVETMEKSVEEALTLIT